ncbi:SRPBCC domain-containing protein [Flavobacterium sp. LS2P90]|uniref:SRPBCC domain-containing protein n=1 Tax=Flavobacterium xylosi TaxID=3230415 RepID=A0ABW6HXQ5_9FLAO
MANNSKTLVVKDLKEKSILVSRTFNAPLEKVWRAYTESDLLEQWWAHDRGKPKPKQCTFLLADIGCMLWSVLKMRNIGDGWNTLP